MPLAFRSSRRPPGAGGGPGANGAGATVGFGAGVAAAAAFAFAVHKAARLRSPVGPSQWKSAVAEDGTVPEFEDLLQHVADKGLEPEIRPELWPLLLCVYGPDETTEDRAVSYDELRHAYDELLRRCQELEVACLDAISVHRRPRHSSGCGTAAPTTSSATSASTSASPIYVRAPADNAGPSATAAAPPADASSLPSIPLDDSVWTKASSVWGEEAAGLGACLPGSSEHSFLGHLSRNDVPPALRPYWEAQQSIAMDAIRVDFRKASLPGAAAAVTGGGGGLSISLRGLGFSGLGGGANTPSAWSLAPAMSQPTPAAPSVDSGGNPAAAGSCPTPASSSVPAASGGSGRLTSWLRERMELYQASRAARQQQQEQRQQQEGEQQPQQPQQPQEEQEEQQQLAKKEEAAALPQSHELEQTEADAEEANKELEGAAVDDKDELSASAVACNVPLSCEETSAVITKTTAASPDAPANPSDAPGSPPLLFELEGDSMCGPAAGPNNPGPVSNDDREATSTVSLSAADPVAPLGSETKQSPIAAPSRGFFAAATAALQAVRSGTCSPSSNTRGQASRLQHLLSAPELLQADCSPAPEPASVLGSCSGSTTSTPRHASEGGALACAAGAGAGASFIAGHNALVAGRNVPVAGATGAAGGPVAAPSAFTSASSGGVLWLSGLARFHLDHAVHFTAGQRCQVERLVVLLSAYAAHDPALGYCQGMSDLALPFVLLLEDDVMAFWCFARLMTKVRANFLPREDGVFERLATLGSLLAALDPALGQHLAGLHADHCHFAHRMVAVQMRRELPADLAVRVWEQLWADDLLEQLVQRRAAEERKLERRRAAEAGAVELTELGSMRRGQDTKIEGTGDEAAGPEVLQEEGRGLACMSGVEEMVLSTDGGVAVQEASEGTAKGDCCAQAAAGVACPALEAAEAASKVAKQIVPANDAAAVAEERQPEAAPAKGAAARSEGQRESPGERTVAADEAEGSARGGDVGEAANPLLAHGLSGCVDDPAPAPPQESDIAPEADPPASGDAKLASDADKEGLPPVAAATAPAVAVSTLSTTSTSTTSAGATTDPSAKGAAATQRVDATTAALRCHSAFGRELFQYLVAAVVLSQRRRLLECRELDDVLRVFQSLASLGRGDMADALRRAKEHRDKVAPLPTVCMGGAAAAPRPPPPVKVAAAAVAAPSGAAAEERGWRFGIYRNDPPAPKL